jgi:hypothetical protein
MRVGKPEITMTTPPPYTTPADFLFAAPPYDQLLISEEQVRELLHASLRLDGYCPYCGQIRTFNRTNGRASDHWMNYSNSSSYYDRFVLTCAREDHHKLNFHIYLNEDLIQKVGQFPSFADIALDESKTYNKFLSREDAAEFHRAIGLAAHNVGIGSFVYLRRIFERLIDKRYKEFKEVEKWADEDFFKLRMAEKIAFLEKHLPPFLVKNAKIYSILSVGLHELTEAQCLSFFKVLRQSMTLILEEDKKKREELEMQKELEKAIASFNPTPDQPTPMLRHLQKKNDQSAE